MKGASHPPGQLLIPQAVYCFNEATPEPQWLSMFHVISYTKSVADAPGQQMAFCRVTQGPRLLRCCGSAYPPRPGRHLLDPLHSVGSGGRGCRPFCGPGLAVEPLTYICWLELSHMLNL